MPWSAQVPSHTPRYVAMPQGWEGPASGWAELGTNCQGFLLPGPSGPGGTRLGSAPNHSGPHRAGISHHFILESKTISPCLGSLKLLSTSDEPPQSFVLQTAAWPSSRADLGKLGKNSTKDHGDGFMGSRSTEPKPKQSCFPYNTWIF